jgi:hypothetical protein
LCELRIKTIENMENLTQKQKEEVKVLVRLGDTLELAIKTVLNTSDVETSNLYQIAYYS